MTPIERTAWLLGRQKGIGGSDIAAILGISPFRSEFETWLSKTGRDTTPDEDDDRRKWGRRLESPILDDWEDRFGQKLVRGKCVRHPAHSIIMATLDGSTEDDSIVVEVKNVDITPREPQPYYVTQVLWEMLASGAKTGYLTELVHGNSVTEFVFHAAEHEARMNDLAQIGLDWWTKHVIGDLPPDPLARDVQKVQMLFPTVDEAAVVHLDDDLVSQLVDAKAELEEAQMKKDGLQTKLEMQMGEAKRGLSKAGKVSWYGVKGRESIDAKALAAAHPAISAQFTRRGQDYRVFKLT